MARLTVRNILDNGWLDQCNSEFYFRDSFNSNWVRFFPDQTLVRDSGNNQWLQVDCTYDPILDDPCKSSEFISSITCADVPINEAGSGDGVGSDGDSFDILRGYPAGYDLPDAGDTGFGLQRTYGTYSGWSLNRPGLDGTRESYTAPATNSFLGHGTYANPAHVRTHTFSNGSALSETIYNVGDRKGNFEILYACYDNPTGISFDVYYLGALIASTCGRVTGRGKLEFSLDPAIGGGESRVMIRTRGEEKTRWMFSLVGPKNTLALPVFEPGNNVHLAQVRTTEYIGTSLFPAPSHARVYPFTERLSNGEYWYEYVHHVGLLDPATGPYVLHLNYETWENADWVEVYHGGERIASTMTSKAEDGLLSIVFDAYRFIVPVPDLVVKVMTRERTYASDIESQEYMLYDAHTKGYKENRWNCEEPIAGLTSAGHYSTEDHYDMNDINEGVASLKVIGYGDFQYTAAVYDEEGELITAAQGTGTTFLQWFKLPDDPNVSLLDKISVRINAPIDSSWVYYVGCYIPLLDISIDDQLAAACPDLEININSPSVYEGQQAKFLVSLNAPYDTDVTVDYTTEDITASASAQAPEGAINPYPLYREDGIISSAIYEDDQYNYTFMVEADPHRIYGPTQNGEPFDYMAGLFYPDIPSASQFDPVSTHAELPTYYKMLVNMMESRFGTLDSSIKVLVLTHQRIWSSQTGPQDPYSQETEDIDIVYDMRKAMPHMVESLTNIYGIQVAVEVINYWGVHGSTSDRGYSDADADWSSHTDIITDDYDMIVVDQYGLVRQHIEDNADISSAGDLDTKVFTNGGSTALGVALSRFAKNTSGDKLILVTAGFSKSVNNSNLYGRMNMNAQDVINGLGLSSEINLGSALSTVDNMSAQESVSIQSIIDIAGENDSVWGSISVNDALAVQEEAEYMSKITLSNGGLGGDAAVTDQVDYQFKAGTLTIPAGAASAYINVNTYTDTVSDPNETFKVTLSNPSDGVLGTSEGTCTILEGTAGGTTGDMNIVAYDLTSIGTAYVTSVTYKHPEVLVGLKINANNISFSWDTEGTDYVRDANVAYTDEAGSVAYVTMTETATSVSSPSLSPLTTQVSGKVAEFEYDPARTYTYKWNVTRGTSTIPNSTNNIEILPYTTFLESKESSTPIVTDIDEYSADNTSLSIKYKSTSASTTQAGTAIFEVEIFVQDDLGNIQKSDPIQVIIQQRATVYSGGGGGGCISIDTPIYFADGSYKNAELIKVGDKILGKSIPGMIDENTDGWEDWTTDSLNGSENVEVTVRSAKLDWYKQYWVINSDLKITQQHHLLVKRDGVWGWLDVRDMRIGDKLHGKGGHEVNVGTIKLVKERIDVMVIDVEEIDTYYAGKNPVLIHNLDSSNMNKF